ncbi:M24 family metallopeptidase [Rhodohalobacter sulfatireducens]|uniref:Aminopeptidase P family protein n=1 Tax=Rhodohalobacter sulfatireducens TaxID=2911366 RepID=A0ABS9KAE8_9BACT|nr:M24 family metallopeptidase [Rhodohalobacter sulfatireducens]MCG2587824.1 aminopeptidase P family protein [Rhodohalobacter sulfatireducens]
MKKIVLLFFVISFIIQNPALSQTRNDIQPDILPMRERAEVMDQWTEYRLDNLIPELMRREGIDMWVLVAREYNEDPVLLTMLPATWQSSRRTTILVFFDDGETVERLAVARYNIGFFETQWDPEAEPDQWKRFGEVVAERNPEKIAVNISEDFALADGISHTDYTYLNNSLNADLQDRIVSAENLAIGWLETRTEQEMTIYPQINRIAHYIVAEGLSERVITPGVTTTQDVQWWYREKIRDLKLATWFHPSVSVQRSENDKHTGDFSDYFADDSDVIMPGDLIHIDFGIEYLGLSTDTQRNAYVLRPGETEAPEGLKEALATGNRLQDIFTAEFETSRTGNEILASSLEKAESEGINATIYTHPIGYHGHAAGPTIGLWDQQEGVPGKGDYPLYPNTAHSIELNAEVHVPEWDRTVRIMLEEDAFFDGDSIRYIDGRMKSLYLIPRQN